ncbi:MAG: BsuPI-related putative proteinase inhibitor [Bacillus sp. (in: Bacteria)]|nr:BsuPI-related putative proteinase inhibitor [Bacillus sp. (in: firmicutes)]
MKKSLFVLICFGLFIISGCSTIDETNAQAEELLPTLVEKEALKQGEYRFGYILHNPNEESVTLFFQDSMTVDHLLVSEDGEILGQGEPDNPQKPAEVELNPGENLSHDFVFLGLEKGSYTLSAWLVATNLEEEYKLEIEFEVD